MPESLPGSTTALQAQLATALSDAAYFKASYARKLEDEKRLLEAAAATVEALAAANARADAAVTELAAERREHQNTTEERCRDREAGLAALSDLAAARRECDLLRDALASLRDAYDHVSFCRECGETSVEHFAKLEGEDSDAAKAIAARASVDAALAAPAAASGEEKP